MLGLFQVGLFLSLKGRMALAMNAVIRVTKRKGEAGWSPRAMPFHARWNVSAHGGQRASCGTGGWSEEPGSAKLPTGHAEMCLARPTWRSDDQEEWLGLGWTRKGFEIVIFILCNRFLSAFTKHQSKDSHSSLLKDKGSLGRGWKGNSQEQLAGPPQRSSSVSFVSHCHWPPSEATL